MTWLSAVRMLDNVHKERNRLGSYLEELQLFPLFDKKFLYYAQGGRWLKITLHSANFLNVSL